MSWVRICDWHVDEGIENCRLYSFWTDELCVFKISANLLYDLYTKFTLK